MVCWLGLCTVTAKGPGSVPGRETKIPQAMWYSQKKKIPVEIVKDQSLPGVWEERRMVGSQGIFRKVKLFCMILKG